MARQWSARCYGVARQRDGSRQNSIGTVLPDNFRMPNLTNASHALTSIPGVFLSIAAHAPPTDNSALTLTALKDKLESCIGRTDKPQLSCPSPCVDVIGGSAL